MKDDKLRPIHSGEVLWEEFIKPMNVSPNQLAVALQVPEHLIEAIIRSEQSITADTALRLARHFNMSPRFWLGLQMDYDLDVAEDELGERLNEDVAVLVAQ